MQILEYKLHASSKGMTCPPWIKEGGYWNNPDDYTFVGVAESSNEFYIPDTVTVLTLAELKTRQLAIHAKYPMQKTGESNQMIDMTNAEVEASVDDWWANVQ